MMSLEISMPKPKRHHFLPEFYLEGFTRDGMLCVFDRAKNEYRWQPPKNTAVIGHFYVFLNTEHEQDYSLETMLSQVEGRAKPIIEKLERGDDITPEERVHLALFIAVLFNRVPKFERETDEIADATVKHMLKHMVPTVEAAEAHLRADGGHSDISPEYYLDFIQNERFTVKGNRNIAIRTMLEQLPEISKTLALMDWMVAHADPRSAFITTDAPFGFIVPEAIRRSGEPALGVGSPKVTKIVPLSGRIALLIGGFGARFGHFGFERSHVRDLNVAVAAECDRYVIGRDEALVRSVVQRSKVDRSNPGTKMRVEHIPHPTDPTRTFMISRRVPADASDEPLKIVIEE